MKAIPLLFVLLSPFALFAEDARDSFPTDQDRSIMANTLGVEAADIQFMERADFNSVFKRYDRNVRSFRGYVVATDSEMFLILNDRLDARKSDVWSIGIDHLRGVYATEEQVLVNVHPFIAVVIEFEEEGKNLYAELKNLLLDNGVRSDWEPPATYTLREFKKPLIGVPYEKPSVFASSRFAQRTRDVASFKPNWYNHANSWQPPTVGYESYQEPE